MKSTSIRSGDCSSIAAGGLPFISPQTKQRNDIKRIAIVTVLFSVKSSITISGNITMASH